MPLSPAEENEVAQFGEVDHIISESFEAILIRLADGRVLLLRRTGFPRTEFLPASLFDTLPPRF